MIRRLILLLTIFFASTALFAAPMEAVSDGQASQARSGSTEEAHSATHAPGSNPESMQDAIETGIDDTN